MGLPTDLPFPDPATVADPRERDALRAWRAIAELFLSQQGHRERVGAELGLTMAELVPLFHLVPDGGISQRDLAHEWSCDPSWVTNRIDRLEELGLAERRVSPTDRRVKEVWLTPEGVARRSRGLAGFTDPPEALQALSAADLHDLARILAKLPLPTASAPPTGHDVHRR